MLYPHISINGTFGWQAPRLNQLFTPLSFQGSYGPSFEWDMLNYGRLMNNIRFEKAKFQEVVATYQNKVLIAAEEVENGMVMFVKAQEEVKFLDQSVASLTEAVRIGTEQVEKGKVDENRFAVLAQNKVQQELLLAQAQGDVDLGLVQVYRALGGGWQIRCQGCPASGAFAPDCAVQADKPASEIRTKTGTLPPVSSVLSDKSTPGIARWLRATASCCGAMMSARIPSKSANTAYGSSNVALKESLSFCTSASERSPMTA